MVTSHAGRGVPWDLPADRDALQRDDGSAVEEALLFAVADLEVAVIDFELERAERLPVDRIRGISGGQLGRPRLKLPSGCWAARICGRNCSL
jgi:hypothetical protein